MAILGQAEELSDGFYDEPGTLISFPEPSRYSPIINL